MQRRDLPVNTVRRNVARLRPPNQMQRAAVSIMSNIAEGFEWGSRVEFMRFLMIAKASCAELRSQLYIALDVGYLSPERFNQLLVQAEEVARIIGGLRVSLKKRQAERQ